jgi:hypothetical protein
MRLLSEISLVSMYLVSSYKTQTLNLIEPQLGEKRRGIDTNTKTRDVFCLDGDLSSREASL